MRKEPKPFVKWAGGKRYILDEISSRLPKKFNCYFEPFLGGGAVYFKFVDKVKSATLSDNNAELINAYRVIKSSPLELINKLRVLASNHSKEFYYFVRKRNPKGKVDRAARFIYLNRTCYNGLYRVNNAGRFNVPVGRYINPAIVQEENVIECHKVLKSTRLLCTDFENIKPKKGDFVYIDPPYQPSEYGGFTRYTREDFTKEDQLRLSDFVKELTKSGVYVMVSNSKSQLVQKLYPGKYFKIHTVYAPRFVNCKGDRRKKVKELLITNY